MIDWWKKKQIKILKFIAKACIINLLLIYHLLYLLRIIELG